MKFKTFGSFKPYPTPLAGKCSRFLNCHPTHHTSYPFHCIPVRFGARRMGNCMSNDADWQQKYTTLKFEAETTIANYKKENDSLMEQREKALEQGNLLRFKVEVLINMLAIEEKKMETSNKRLEALKWVLLSQGVSQATVTNLLSGSVDNIKDLRLSLERKIADFDMSRALVKMAEDFDAFRKDIIQCFADDTGKIVASLSKEEFMRQLYSVTERVSKNDVQVIAFRFSDGTSVSVSEFLNFFSTPASIREAKAAAAAVRMSLDLLALDLDENLEAEIDSPNTKPAVKVPTSTVRTVGLDKAVQKLLAMWSIITDPLHNTFEEIKMRLNGSQVILESDFKAELLRLCGAESIQLREFLLSAKDKDLISKILPLNADDLDLISERFEIGGRVHFGHFLQFFDELGTLTNNASTSASATKSTSKRNLTHSTGSSRAVIQLGASPFRMSSEWNKLKSSASFSGNEGEEKPEENNSVSIRTLNKSSSLKPKPTQHMTPFTPGTANSLTATGATPQLAAPPATPAATASVPVPEVVAESKSTAPPPKAPKPKPVDNKSEPAAKDPEPEEKPADAESKDENKAIENSTADRKDADDEAVVKSADKPDEKAQSKSTEIPPAVARAGCGFFSCFSTSNVTVPSNPPINPAIQPLAAQPDAVPKTEVENNATEAHLENEESDEELDMEGIEKALSLEEIENQARFGTDSPPPNPIASNSPVRLPPPKALKPGQRDHESTLREKMHNTAKRIELDDEEQQ